MIKKFFASSLKFLGLAIFLLMTLSCKKNSTSVGSQIKDGNSPANGIVDISDKIFVKHFLQEDFNNVFQRFLTRDGQFKVARYLAHKTMYDFTKTFQDVMEEYFRSPKFLNGVTYSAIKLGNPKHLRQAQGDLHDLINLYYMEKYLLIAEAIDDPRYSSQAGEFGDLLSKLGPPDAHHKNVERAIDCAVKSSGAEPEGLARQIGNCLDNSFPAGFAKLDIVEEIPNHPGVVISRTGFIEGNKVTLLNQNQGSWDQNYVKTLEDYHNSAVKSFVEKYKGLSEEQMVQQFVSVLQKNPADPISEIFSNGQPNEAFDPNKNPVWQPFPDRDPNDKIDEKPENQTFARIIKEMRGAESTIFLDMFFLGGSMGVSIVNEILHLLQTKPNLKFIMLHDDINHYGHGEEMLPVFNFLRAYMVVHPDRMLVIPSYFYKNASGFPSYVDELIDDKKLREFGFDNKLSLYLKAKSDHSKAMIIDGDLFDKKPPIAIIGSKNWTDMSGALCNDEVILVEGPAAAVILDNYWRDLFIAAKFEFRGDEDGSFMKAHFNEIFEKGWAKNYATGYNGPDKDDFSKKLQFLIAPLDLQKRFSHAGQEFVTKVEPVVVKTAGTDMVRIGENSIGSFITSCIYQNVHAILNAKSQILINDQLLISANIVAALIQKAKEGVKVKAILESYDYDGAYAPGMPNVIFLDKMNEAGIEVKWKKHGPSAVFIPEHHGKTISVDGFDEGGQRSEGPSSVLIIGSANKDLMTMQGGFRETQVETFSGDAQRLHDMRFWKEWHDDKQGTEIASVNKLEGSPLGIVIQQSHLDTPAFLSYVRGFMEMAYSLKTIDRDVQ